MNYSSEFREYKLFSNNGLDAIKEVKGYKKLNSVLPVAPIPVLYIANRQNHENNTDDFYCQRCDEFVDEYHYRFYHGVLPVHTIASDLQHRNVGQQHGMHSKSDIASTNGTSAALRSQQERPATRDVTQISQPIITFGQKGESDGQLSRPWGICCDNENRIIITDRKNYRVQVFNVLGTFLYKFGSEGSDDGQFKLPVAVAVDNALQRIIVSDKDNHRIQIFQWGGKFLRKFGGKGNLNGQFYYPWDVAVNSRHEILVADSRNRRIQLFDGQGQFLRKIPIDTLKTPRGVFFTRNDEIVITDFDDHRLIVTDEFKTKMMIGCETPGDDDGQFDRPSGIAVDEEGNFIVVDSKNHRIQIFDSNGHFLHKFGKEGSEPGEFDRPSDVCVLKSGYYIVMDSNNSRIQIF